MNKNEAIERIKKIIRNYNLEMHSDNSITIPKSEEKSNLNESFFIGKAIGLITAFREIFEIKYEDIHPPKQTKLEILNGHGIWEESCWTKEDLLLQEKLGELKISPYSSNIFVVKWKYDVYVLIYREVKE